MKKSLILTLFLAGLTLVLLSASLFVVNGGRRRIIITEEVIAGDPAAAAGIVLKTASHWDRHLLWNTEYTIGSGRKAKSSFDFCGEKVSWGWEIKPEAKLYFGTGSNAVEGDQAWSQTEAKFAFPKIAERVVFRTMGREYRETVRIGDYYDVYPLLFYVEGCSVRYDSYDKAAEYLTTFFHIPPAEDKLEVEVNKNENGKVYGVRGTRSGDALLNWSAFGEKGIYYTYCLENTQSGESADHGQNMGIFFFPYAKEENMIRLDLMQVEKICDFSRDLTPLALLLDEEENFLYMAAKESGGYSLYVYQLGDGAVLWEQVVLENIKAEKETGKFCQMSLTDGGILLTWKDNYFSFVERKEGQHRFWCGGVFPETMGEIDEEGVQNPFPRENSCMFDGKRLVLAAFEDWENLTLRLAVYDEEGELYCGRYRNSQDKEMAEGDGISPQGARIWAPYSAWSSKKGAAVVEALSVKGANVKGAGEE